MCPLQFLSLKTCNNVIKFTDTYLGFWKGQFRVWRERKESQRLSANLANLEERQRAKG